MSALHNDWLTILEEEFKKDYYLALKQFLEEEYRTKTVYPKEDDLFNALHLTPFHKVKAVILGQDPYHGPEQAHGLSFSVKPEVKMPPSLKNVFKELKEDLGYAIPKHGYLNQWAKEGVLMLNAVLTVRRGEPNSHRGVGWELFTDEMIRQLNEREEPMVFILWGKNAQEKEALITNPQHHIIKSAHPSPFSAHRGFFGSQPFSQTNDFLRSVGIEEINWKIKSGSPRDDSWQLQ